MMLRFFLELAHWLSWHERVREGEDAGKGDTLTRAGQGRFRFSMGVVVVVGGWLSPRVTFSSRICGE